MSYAQASTSGISRSHSRRYRLVRVKTKHKSSSTYVRSGLSPNSLEFLKTKDTIRIRRAKVVKIQKIVLAGSNKRNYATTSIRADSKERVAYVRKFFRNRPRVQPHRESKTKEIRRYIQTQQWDKLVPYVDELIQQIDLGAVALPLISKLLDSVTQDYAVMEKNAFMHEVIQSVTILLKDVMISAIQNNTVDAINSAKRIREILLAAQEVSRVASEEGLSPLPVSKLVQIDVIKGRPIYALK